MMMVLNITDEDAKPLELRKMVPMSYDMPLTKHWVLFGVDEQNINRSLRAQQVNASSEMFGITSLPVWEKLWRYRPLSEPAIMVCTNVLVLKSKHSQSCYLRCLFPLTQKFCLFFSKVPLSTKGEGFHGACRRVYVHGKSVLCLSCVRGSTHVFICTQEQGM